MYHQAHDLQFILSPAGSLPQVIMVCPYRTWNDS